MNNLCLLFKVNLLHLFNLNTLLHEKNTKNKLKLLGFALIMLLAGIIIVIYSYLYLSSMAPILASVDAIDSLFGAMVSASSFMILFTTLYKAVGTIINAKDYELLSALPIPNKIIMISKWGMLYLMNYVINLLVMIPTIYVYTQYAIVEPIFYILAILFSFFLPLIPLVVGSIVGIIIHYLSNQFKKSNYMSILLSFVFILVLIYYSFTLTTPDQLISFGAVLTNILNHIYPLTSVYVNAVCHTDIFSILLFIGLSIVIFSAFVWYVATHYQYLNGLASQTKTNKNYRLKQSHSSSIYVALVKKELGRYLASSIYVMNTAIGIVIQTAGVIYLAFAGIDSVSQYLQMGPIQDMLSGFIPLFLCFTAGLSTTTNSSISIEGKNLWILKTLPVSTMTIFLAKMSVAFLITIPLSIINIILLSIILDLNITTIILSLLITLFYIIFTTLSGLIINLHFPVLDWINEVQIVKQSMSSFLSIFLSLGTLGLAAFLYTHFNMSIWVIYGFLLIIIVLVIIEYLYLKINGQKLFNQL